MADFSVLIVPSASLLGIFFLNSKGTGMISTEFLFKSIKVLYLSRNILPNYNRIDLKRLLFKYEQVVEKALRCHPEPGLESPNIMILLPVCCGQGCLKQFSMTFCITYEFLNSP